MVCPNCGAVNPETQDLCAQCGRGLRAFDDGQTVLLDGPVSAAPSRTPPPAVSAGVITPPPESSLTWGAAPLQPGANVPQSLPSGSAFGTRYRIEGLLGEGGMGAVYKAHDQELNRTVALKLVRPELASNPQTMKRFKQELLLASRISHKNILRIHDLGDWNGIKFISMAYVEGPDLAALLDREGRLPLERALKFTRQLCAALEAAHHEGVVHRDLKPQNILIDSSDNLYISDFGLAKSLEAQASLMTRTGQILGTPRYMSPEQVEAREVDHRADLYSLGLIVYEMFTGDLPFRGESAMQLMYQRVNEPPRDPRAACPEVPEYVANLILRCLAKDPAKRYQSAREILNDLDAMHAPAPAATPGSKTISIQIPQPSKRGWTIGVVSIVLIAALLAAIPATRNAIRGMLPGAAGNSGQTGIQHYLAVLPLQIGDAPALQYLADGINDSLAAKLSGLRNVYVASGNMLTAAMRQKTDSAIAHAAGVKILVRGNLQTSGDKVSITIHMDDTVNNKPLLKPTEFTGTRQDLLTLEDKIFNALADALVIRQSNEEKARTALQPTQDIEAYDMYLKGRNLIRGAQNKEKAEQALALFNQATSRDPAFALAYAGAADACMILFAETKDDVWTQTALGAAQQAKRLNDSLPEVHYSLGTIYTRLGQSGEAFAELRRAVELAPNSDEGYRRLGTAYSKAGQLDQALAPYLKATEINPYFWGNFNFLGNLYFNLGENAKALQAYQTVTRLEPGNATGWGNLGAAKYRLGQAKAAIPDIQKAISLQQKPAAYNQLGVAYFFLGQYAEATTAFETAVKMAPKEAFFQVNLADAYRGSGQQDKALATYDQAIALSFQALKTKPTDTAALAYLATSYAKKGDTQKALGFIAQARQIDSADNDLMYRAATIYALANDYPAAFSMLKRALQSGYSVDEAKMDPELAPLRSRPEWPELLRELKK